MEGWIKVKLTQPSLLDFIESIFTMATSGLVDLSEVPLAERLSLKGRNYLITGGGRGMGFAAAKAIAQLGGGVAIIDNLSEPVEEFHTLRERFGVNTSYARGDVTDQKSLEAAFEASVNAVGQLHGGLMAAGICIEDNLIDADWDISMRMLQVNVMGTFWSAKLLARHLVHTKTPGSLVFIASLLSYGVKMPISKTNMYNASKAAVKGLVGPLGVQLGPHGIRVNSISPGVIGTPMTQGFEASTMRFFEEATPLGRIGVTDEISPLVCYLLSDLSSFSTGGDYLVTGGIHAGTAEKWNSRVELSSLIE